ncbi:MAG TPA: ROK family transcriptional regulator [Trebonia sp.]|jgi:predicted NBD/HSP70 family sugar kinase|nr:ROK family transcriptional regulator [Trebonia sp.]
MRERRRWTVHDLRRDNRSVLLSSLFFEQPSSRQELSAATGLSPASVSNVVRDLIDDGIVVEAGSEDSDGGRPRMLLQVNPDHGYVVGVDVGETRVRVELFDLTLTERAKTDYPLDPRQHEVGLIVEAILSGLEVVLAASGVDPAAVLGIGVGVPGIVENGPDGLVHGQTYGWESVPLGRLLRAGTSLPLHIDNDARTMGQAELWFGAGRGTRSAVVCLIGSGVGACISTNGTALRGSTSSASEWGHTTVMVGGRPCRCGSRGCLEAYVGAEAILEQYGGPLPGDQEAALAAMIELAATSAQAAEVLDRIALYLGGGIANLINLFNPQRIIVGGWAGLLLGEHMMPAIREGARERSLRHLFAGTSIELGRLGPDAVALGAATLPIGAFLGGSVFTSGESGGPLG